jgi:hexosaminidase
VDSPQRIVDALATGLAVRLVIQDNRADEHGVDGVRLGAAGGLCFTGEFQLRATRGRLPGSGWGIHFSCLRRILATTDPRFTVRHVTGDHYVLTPTDAFPGWAPGETVRIGVIGEDRIMQISEVPPRWFVAADSAQARTIASTDSEDAATYVTVEGDGRMSDSDRTTTVTAQARFARNSQAPALPPNPVRPVPAAIRTIPAEGALHLADGIRLALDLLDPQRVEPLRRALAEVGLAPGPRAVALVGAVAPEALPEQAARPGGYLLTVAAGQVRATGYDDDGLCNAVRAFVSLVGPHREPIPAVTIIDAPRFSHRGLLLDIARNFLDVSAIKAIIEQMAALRLNVLHLHLTDDEGWRLEIKGLPELTEIGGRRGHSPGEEDLLDPQLGCGPYPTTTGTGWLTGGDYIDILRFAAARGIRVIPEFDMPGHSRAAVIAMEARYARLRAEGASEEVASWLRLVEPADQTQMTTVQHYDRRSVLNPGLPSTFAFIEHVVSAVALLHAQAGVPLESWHIGADEVRNIMLGQQYTDIADPVPGRGLVDQMAQDQPWARSPAANQLVSNGTVGSLPELTTWFARTVDMIVRRHGVQRTYVWHEGVEHATGVEQFGGPVTVMAWTSTAWGLAGELAHLRRRGFDVVCSAPDFLYFDFPYEVHPRERGVSWATRAIDGRKVFSLAPENVAQVAEVAVNRLGEHFSVEAEPEAHVVGMQAQLWTENVRGAAQAQSMIFPRLIAAAERAWHRAGWELPAVPGQVFTGGVTEHVDTAALMGDWAEFAATVTDRVLPRMDRAGVNYRVPCPGVRPVPGGVEVNCSNPGLPMQFSVDGGHSWADCQVGFGPAAGRVHVRVLNSDRSRHGRAEVVAAGPIATSGPHVREVRDGPR